MSKYSKYCFSDTEYLAAHGKAPRGRGEWAFEINGEHKMPVAYYTGRSYGTTVTVFFIPGSLSLTEAADARKDRLRGHAGPAAGELPAGAGAGDIPDQGGPGALGQSTGTHKRHERRGKA